MGVQGNVKQKKGLVGTLYWDIGFALESVKLIQLRGNCRKVVEETQRGKNHNKYGEELYSEKSENTRRDLRKRMGKRKLQEANY